MSENATISTDEKSAPGKNRRRDKNRNKFRMEASKNRIESVTKNETDSKVENRIGSVTKRETESRLENRLESVTKNETDTKVENRIESVTKSETESRLENRPHQITRDGIKFDDEAIKVPDMKEPVVNKAKPKKKNLKMSRSNEMKALLGGVTRLELRKKRLAKSIAFISNKGGVGKTHISSNMSFCLARSGKQALLIDLDLGNSDVTNKLGFYCDNTIVDMIQGKAKHDDLIYNTPHGFDMIAGESGNLKLANLTPAQKNRFIKTFKDTSTDYDYVIYDLQAGLGSTTLDFALAQDFQVVVTTPQDIVAGYSCLKAAFQRFQEIEKKLSRSDKSYKQRKIFRPFLIINQVANFDEGRHLFEKIYHVVRQNLIGEDDYSIDLHLLGVVTADNGRIREAELKHFLYSAEYGASHTGQCFDFLVQNLVNYKDPNGMSFTGKIKRFFDIFMKSVNETKYAR